MPWNYSQEFCARAVGLVQDRLKDDPSQSQSRIVADVALKLGVGKESLRRWMTHAEIEAGDRLGVTREESAEIKRLRKENAELRRTNELLKAASAFFARELAPPQRRT